MATDTVAALPAETPDWLDGATEIELSTRHLMAKWDADILDVDDKNKHDTIIERKDEFLVRFRVYLKGRLWKCIEGCWCFDVGFSPIGDGQALQPVRSPGGQDGIPHQGLEGLQRAVHREMGQGARRHDPRRALRNPLRGGMQVRASLLRLLRRREQPPGRRRT